MKKKILIMFFTVLAVAAASLWLTACGEHVHTYSEELASDSYYHWHAATCEHENEISGKAEHNWDEGKVTKGSTCGSEGIITYTCTDCGKTKNESVEKIPHTYSEEWTGDSYYHWHAATCGHENEISGKAEHNWDEGEISQSASCADRGIKTFTCNDCGEEKYEIIEKTEHIWDEGIITTQPTCITSGVMTFTCTECHETKKEIIDADAEKHMYGEYEYDETQHWRTCRLCGYVFIEEHEFDGLSKESNVDEVLECGCGINKTVGEFYSFKVTFEFGNGVSVLTYNTKDYNNGKASNVAYVRDADTGELLNDGTGQVNFKLDIAMGYVVKGITVEPSNNYNQIKGPSDVGKANTYRITKITGEITVSVETEFLGLPVMVINTQDNAPILDKENYVTCSVSVNNAETNYCFSEVSAGIRGRGNTTWGLDKKPYKLKFDKKIDLFGNGSAKKWNLIANYNDPSLLRNYFAYSIGAQLDGIAQTTTTVEFIELYLNQEYLGVYLVCEQNEAGSTRVNIDEDIINEDGSIKVNTGYLLESDIFYVPTEGIEGIDYFRVSNKCFGIVSPDVEDEYFIEHSAEFVAFIKNIVQTAMNNLNNLTNTPDNFDKISKIIDIPSFLDGYFIDELTNNADGEYSSFYIYYDNADGKLYRGPIWDYDASCGNAAYRAAAGYGDNNPTNMRAKSTFWYDKLLKFDGFKQLLRERLQGMAENDSFINFLDSKCTEIFACGEAFERNFEKWDGVLGQSNLAHWNTEAIISITTWSGQVDYLIDWIKTSFDNLITVYCS